MMTLVSGLIGIAAGVVIILIFMKGRQLMKKAYHLMDPSLGTLEKLGAKEGDLLSMVANKQQMWLGRNFMVRDGMFGVQAYIWPGDDRLIHCGMDSKALFRMVRRGV